MYWMHPHNLFGHGCEKCKGGWPTTTSLQNNNTTLERWARVHNSFGRAGGANQTLKNAAQINWSNYSSPRGNQQAHAKHLLCRSKAVLELLIAAMYRPRSSPSRQSPRLTMEQREINVSQHNGISSWAHDKSPEQKDTTIKRAGDRRSGDRHSGEVAANHIAGRRSDRAACAT